MASDRLARQLLNMTSDPNVADPVKLAAIKDALDRSGIQAKTAVSVEVSTKPYELVFDRIGSAPREAQTALAIEGESLDQTTDNQISESGNDEIVGEFDDDVIEDDYPSGFSPESEFDIDVVDVEIVDADYTDDGSGTTTPPDPSSSLSVDLSGTNPGPLGVNGPVNSGLMSLSDATEAVADMRARQAAQAAHVRDLRRR